MLAPVKSQREHGLRQAAQHPPPRPGNLRHPLLLLQVRRGWKQFRRTFSGCFGTKVYGKQEFASLVAVQAAQGAVKLELLLGNYCQFSNIATALGLGDEDNYTPSSYGFNRFRLF